MLTLPGGKIIRAPSSTIPFELFGTKITVTTTGGGANVSVKLDDLGKFLAREYLAHIVPVSYLTELINSYLNIKFSCSTSIGYNYKKPKREDLGGLARDVLNNVAVDVQGLALGDNPVRLEIWNTLDDLSGVVPQQRATDPIRTIALKIVGTLSIAPKTRWVPFSGAFKIVYSAVYAEYLDRIEIHLADISIAGGLKYRLDIELPFKVPVSGPEQRDTDPFRLQYPHGGTIATSAPPRDSPTLDDFFRQPYPRGGTRTPSPGGSGLSIDHGVELGGSSKIKKLTFKEELPAATFSYDRRTGTYGFRSIGEQQFRVLVILVLLLFLNFTSMFTDLSGQRT